jgi:hypothetical protein
MAGCRPLQAAASVAESSLLASMTAVLNGHSLQATFSASAALLGGNQGALQRF